MLCWLAALVCGVVAVAVVPDRPNLSIAFAGVAAGFVGLSFH